MMLKSSSYNYVVKDENGDYLVCNLIIGYKSLRKIRAFDADMISLLEHGQRISCDLNAVEFQALIDAGFLIDEKENELFKIKTLYETQSVILDYL